ncbi:MAG: guanylate kinase [Peptococcaceae bacterium]|jgi:guanylate kinase|nr:guanylate kinase [Peptococcaceae bacterium]
MSKQTALYVISGPSGVGKGTVCKALLAELGEGPNRQLTLSISATTRPMRPGEVDGVNYHFLSQEDFLRRVDNGEFLEYATVYGNYYGTLRSAVQQELAEGRNVLLEIDTDGARQIKKLMPEAELIFLAPPSPEELLRRLQGRNTDSAAEIARRQQCLEAELAQQVYYDYVVVNDVVEDTVAQIRQIMAKGL